MTSHLEEIDIRFYYTKQKKNVMSKKKYVKMYVHVSHIINCFVKLWINYALRERSYPDNLQFTEDSTFPLYFTRNKNNQGADLRIWQYPNAFVL